MDTAELPASGSSEGSRVAIVGGGAAAALLALQLAERGIATTLFDRAGAFARGVAYSATSPWHRLNVPIDKMGGWRADEHDTGFHDWFVARRGQLSAHYPDRYVSRSDYGAWMRSELDRIVAQGAAELQRRDVHKVSPAGAGAVLEFADGSTSTAPAAVLCLGNQQPRPLPISLPRRSIADMWAPGAMAVIGPDEPVLIVGTGSTGIDAMLELHHRGHRAAIYMLSRRGMLPLVDAPPAEYALTRTIVSDAPRLVDVMHRLRREAREAMAKGHTWQSVVDAFRASIPRLWKGLSAADRGRFLRHLRGYWLVHRHRLAPDIAELVQRKQGGGSLVMLTGRLRSAREHATGLAVEFDERRGGTRTLPVGWVINCTGPEEDFRRVGDPLPQYLFQSGVARPGRLGVGFDVDDDGRLLDGEGSAHSRLFVLGGATRTRFGEVTSSPQIRRRAALLTQVIARELAGASVR